MEAQKSKFDSIIFDLDGTLWDSTANVAEAWTRAAAEVDYIREEITQDTVRSITGMTYDAIFEKLFPYLTEEKRNEFKSIAAKHEIDTLDNKGGHLYPGVIETLTYLQLHHRLFIVSNCQSGYIETFFKMDGVADFFESHQCFGTKGQPKWQNIKDVIEDNNLLQPVYIGDTMGDYEAATKANVPFIFAAYGFGHVDMDQFATINNFADLQKIF